MKQVRLKFDTLKSLLWVALWVALASFLAGPGGPLWAQTGPTKPLPEDVVPQSENGTPPPREGTDTETPNVRPDEPLSEQLERKEGVIKPPPGMDPGIHKPAPNPDP